MRLSKNRVLRRIFGPERASGKVIKEDCALRSFIVCTVHLILLW
jgi:hypothetical protein